MTVHSTLLFQTDNNIILDSLKNITIDSLGTITDGSGGNLFSKKRMIQQNGVSPNSSKVIKYFPSSLANPSTYCPDTLLTTGQYITEVKFGTLDKTSGQSSYSDFTSSVPPPTITANVPTKIYLRKNLNTGTMQWRVWIDCNQNGIFDPADKLGTTGNYSTFVDSNLTITIPTTALNGLTRMRIQLIEDNTAVACQVGTKKGEVEDYLINVTGGVSLNTTVAFNFPIGVDTIFNPAIFNLTARTQGSPFISVKAIKGKHPARLTNNILEKYWTVSSTGITLDTTLGKKDSIQFYFSNTEINGDLHRYLPGRHKATGWEINLGVDPRNTTNTAVTLDTILIDREPDLNGDWTCGDPLVYFNGRIFYSRIDGNWNNRLIWSNEPTLKHFGPSASYFPGQLYSNDTVNIDGATVLFRDSVHIVVDSLRIGGSRGGVDTAGVLRFDTTYAYNKTLETRSLFMGNDNGQIIGNTTVNPFGRKDTIALKNNFVDSTISPGTVSLYYDPNNYTVLKFFGPGNAEIRGGGVWGNLANIVMNKSEGLIDTLKINSGTFVAATKAAGSVFSFFPLSGVLRHMINDTLYLSSSDADVIMGTNSGLDILNGSIFAKKSLYSNNFTTINLNGGNLYVGDATDENFYYKTGTTLKILKGSMLVAGAFSQFGGMSTNNIIDFTLLSDTVHKGELKVITKGNTNANIVGFDMSSSLSSFTMNGGRIVICNKNGTTPASFDSRINAIGGTGMTGGVLQCGDSTLTPNDTKIKIGGVMPVYNLHFANTTLRDTTVITEQTFNIIKDWTIDANHYFNLSGNTVYLGGNLSNYGFFNAKPGATTTEPWQIVLNGSTIQTLLSVDTIRLYNFRLNKGGGNVKLASTGNSNLKVCNTLEFSTNNLSVIDASTGSRSVTLNSEFGSTPQILRNGKGHIYGRLYMNMGTDNQTVKYFVGADSINSYRPVTIQTVGTGGTAGYVGVRAFNYTHPDTASSLYRNDNNIPRYWNVDSLPPFTLGSRNFNLTLQFCNPGDLVNNPTVSNFEMFNYYPPWQPPYTPPPPGTWSSLTSPEKTDTTIKSTGDTKFGDFAIGEPKGVTFYSTAADGYWDNTATWSWVGYDDNTHPTRTPNLPTDIVRIGNNKIVRLKYPFLQTVRSVIVEKYNNKPGIFYIEGDVNVIYGNSFSLADGCTLGLEHIQGLCVAGTANGPIQTISRTYGVSRYIYNRKNGSQICGNALPDSIQTLIVDMTDTLSTYVRLELISPNDKIRVKDTVQLLRGAINIGSLPELWIYNTLQLDSVHRNEGKMELASSTVNFAGTMDKYLTLKNHSGVNFNNLILGGGVLHMNRVAGEAIDQSLANVHVTNTLNFAGPSVIALGDNLSLYIDTSNTGAIQNYALDHYVRTSVTSGYLYLNVAKSSTYIFPIGSLDASVDHYAPVTFYAGSTGTTGLLGIRTSPGQNVSHPGAHLYISSSPYAEYLKRYWAIDTCKATINGKLRFQYLNTDVSGYESDFTKVGRWRPNRENPGGPWMFPFATLTIDTNANYFETDANYAYGEFMGDWTIGNNDAYRRIFFSRQSGIWNDPQQWTYSPTHSGAIFGGYPNDLPTELNDSVVIGGGIGTNPNHVIQLDKDRTLGGLALGIDANNKGTLDCRSFNILGNYFTMGNGSYLKIGSPNGISLLGTNTGNIQTIISRAFNSNGIYEYNGTVDQVTGTGLPGTISNLVINDSLHTVTLTKPESITNALIISSGRLDLLDSSANSTGSATFTINDSASVRIGGSKNLLSSINNYSSYTIGAGSYIEFNGDSQDISQYPTNLNMSLGLGNVITNGVGTKSIGATLRARGNFYNQNNARLNINDPKLLQVLKSVINSSTINNNGIIEIGQ
jgi:hypothetical protein